LGKVLLGWRMAVLHNSGSEEWNWLMPVLEGILPLPLNRNRFLKNLAFYFDFKFETKVFCFFPVS
jgi:hypothetical protein